MWRWLFTLLFCTSALAGPNKTQQASVPFSRLFTLTVRDIWSVSQWNTNASSQIIDFRPLVPFEIGRQLNILRLTIPYRTTTSVAGAPGLGDVRVFDLVTFTSEHSLWGVGPVVNLRANNAPGGDAFQGGFVLGLVAFVKRFGFGLLNQNLFSANVNVSTFQPVFICQVSERWVVGLGELPFVFDWKSKTRAFVPVGFQVGYAVGPKDHPLRLFVNPQYNTQALTGSPQWTITTGVTLPVSPIPAP